MSHKRGESNTEKRSRDAKENGMLKSESGEQRKHKFNPPSWEKALFNISLRPYKYPPC